MTPPQTPPVCCRCGNPLPEVWFFTADGTGRAACPNCATDEEKARETFGPLTPPA